MVEFPTGIHFQIECVKRSLKKIKVLCQLYSWYLRFKKLYFHEGVRILLARLRYSRTLHRIRAKYRTGSKIKVVFLASNLSKWKVQSLYDLMKKDDHYEPVVVLTLMDIEKFLRGADVINHFEKLSQYLQRFGCNVLHAYDVRNNRFIPLDSFEADIVWYTQPWEINELQLPFVASEKALCCYVPYFVENYGGFEMSCDLFFHRLLWRHFVPNEAWAKAYTEFQGNRRAGLIKGLGHPMLDEFYLNRFAGVKKEYVIYAPHWSCGVVEKYSTFLENGWKMLDLAKAHPELKWVFKPHPSLRITLEKKCGWRKETIDEYYGEWEKFAIASYDSSYIPLFQRSLAMITDSGSFLMEYACTGCPIIHLISAEAKYKPHQISVKLFETYYQAYNWEDVLRHFSKVVLDKMDYKRTARLAAVSQLRLMDNYAAKNIMDYLREVWCGRND